MTGIILADNDKDIQKTFKITLEGRYNIYIPSRIDDLLIEPFNRASIAIIDHDFSAGSGLEALRSLKSFNPSLPVIFTASKSSEEICIKAFRLGARDYFKKPFLMDDMLLSIESILRYRYLNSGGRINLLLDRYMTCINGDPMDKKDPNIEKVKRFIEEHYNEEITLESLASMACLSKYHFCRRFKKETGMTCTRYINWVRIEKSKKLLLDRRLTISDVCYDTGFNDLTYFERVFREFVGICPSAYRKRYTIPK